jgi:hypothetical protein
MREWINNRFGTDFTENDLLNIKDFSLIWNVFENVVCNNNCSVARLAERLHPIQFEIDEFTGSLEYFKDRYVTTGAVNGRFEYLNFRNKDRRKLVEDVLLGNNHEISSIVLALSIIVYRFRNNLFHGLKEIQFIDQQQTNFENANLVLKAILKHF